MSTRHNIFSLVLHKAALFDLWNWLAPSTESIAGLNTFKPIFIKKKKLLTLNAEYQIYEIF